MFGLRAYPTPVSIVLFWECSADVACPARSLLPNHHMTIIPSHVVNHPLSHIQLRCTYITSTRVDLEAIVAILLRGGRYILWCPEGSGYSSAE